MVTLSNNYIAFKKEYVLVFFFKLMRNFKPIAIPSTYFYKKVIKWQNWLTEYFFKVTCMNDKERMNRPDSCTILQFLILPCFSVKICTRGIAMGWKSLINLTKRQGIGIGIDSFLFFLKIKKCTRRNWEIFTFLLLWHILSLISMKTCTSNWFTQNFLIIL